MPNPNILVSLHGRQFGLSKDGDLVVNQQAKGVAGTSDAQVDVSNVARVSLPAAQVQTLFTTPRTLVAAPGAGLAVIVKRVMVYKSAGTAYGGVAVGEDLAISYTNGSGARVVSTIETTGFLDQTTVQTRVAFPPASTGATAGDINPAANAPVVASLLVGDITTGDSPLVFHVYYDIVPTVLTL